MHVLFRLGRTKHTQSNLCDYAIVLREATPEPMKLNRSNTYALHRTELGGALERGDKAISAMMDGTPLRFNAREELAVQGDGLAHVYRLLEGWCARVRTLPDARVQIIAVYVPGDLLALKAMFLAEQPDGIYALSAVTAAIVDQARLRDAMLTNPDIAIRIAFQMKSGGCTTAWCALAKVMRRSAWRRCWWRCADGWCARACSTARCARTGCR